MHHVLNIVFRSNMKQLFFTSVALSGFCSSFQDKIQAKSFWAVIFLRFTHLCPNVLSWTCIHNSFVYRMLGANALLSWTTLSQIKFVFRRVNVTTASCMWCFCCEGQERGEAQLSVRVDGECALAAWWWRSAHRSGSDEPGREEAAEADQPRHRHAVHISRGATLGPPPTFSAELG